MPSALVLPAVVGGLASGILLTDAGMLSPAITPAVLAGAAILGAVARVGRSAFLAVLAAVALGAGLGVWRGGSATVPIGPGSIGSLVGSTQWRLSGTLVEEPRPKGERAQLILDQVTASADDSAPQHANGRLLVWLPRSTEASAGDRIALRATLDEPRDFDGFAYRAYLARQGIGAIARAYEATVIGHELGPAAEIANAVRRWLLDGLNRTVPEPEAALGAGILLGVRSGISPDIGDAFAAAGLTHVVAISGWNIAIVAALVAATLRPLGRRPGGRWMVPVVTVGAIAGYVVLTGSSPSVVRAALMAAAMLIARLGGSRAHAAGALLLAALVMLLAAPPVLWDVGFQLSLLATAGLIWFGASVEARLRRLPAFLREPVALTLAAQLTTLPVILLNFERLSLVAPLANVLVVPLVPLVMLCCAVAAPVGGLDAALHLPIVGEAATWLAGGSAWLYLHLMVLAGKAAASVPFASVPMTAPGWLAVLWYPLLAAIALRPRQPTPQPGPVQALDLVTPTGEPRPTPALLRALGRPRGLLALSTLLLGVLTLASLPDGRLHLTMLDIGQGDAILVEAPSGHTLLIDGGPDPDLTLGRLGESLPFFHLRIDVVLLTHPHEDHVAGLVEVLRRYRVGLVLDAGRAFDNPSYARFLQLAGSRLREARAGQRVALDARTSLLVLYPTQADADGPLPDEDINNASVVARLEFGAFSALLTGDAEAPVEARLADRGLLTPVDVLKVGHHGSHSSTSAPMLSGARPVVALISDGVGNDYGHPAPETLHALAAAGARVRRTDLEGSVEVTTDGRSYEVVSRVARDPSRPARALALRPPLAGSIGAWPFRDSTTPERFLPVTTFPRASSGTRRACGASRRRRRGWCSTPGSRSMFASSRSPPCSTTSTSREREPRVSRMASSPPAGWARWATTSWPFRSPPTR
jgi:competence protein ComEC